MNKVIGITVILLAISNGCFGLQKRSYKIFRGKDITNWDDNKFKFVAMLGGKGICTASIWSKLTLVTASHCFGDPKYAPDHVQFERTHGEDPPKWIAIKKANMNPEWQKLMRMTKVNGYDMATVILQEPIPMERAHVTIGKFWTKGDIQFGSKVYVIGYGKDRSKKAEAGALRWGMEIFDECPKGKVFGAPLCVYPRKEFNEQDTEVGDSGGPLIKAEEPQKHVIMGVLSGGRNFPDGQYLTQYASVKKYEEFIKQHSE